MLLIVAKNFCLIEIFLIVGNPLVGNLLILVVTLSGFGLFLIKKR